MNELRHHPLAADAWITFLDREVLTVFDEDSGLTAARFRILDDDDVRQVAEWRQAGVGPARSIASSFLRKNGISFREYVSFCRDNHLQPWSDGRVPFDWFCGWFD